MRNVFRSRWQALWWAASIMLTAYCTVPASDDAPQPAAKPHVAAKHVNPWAKDGK